VAEPTTSSFQFLSTFYAGACSDLPGSERAERFRPGVRLGARATLRLPAERKWRKCEQRSVSSVKPIMRRVAATAMSGRARNHSTRSRTSASPAESFERRFGDSRRRRRLNCSRLYRNYRPRLAVVDNTRLSGSITIAVGHARRHACIASLTVPSYTLTRIASATIMSSQS